MALGRGKYDTVFHLTNSPKESNQQCICPHLSAQVVLDANGHAGKRPNILACSNASINGGRLRQRSLLVHSQEAAQPALNRLETAQIGLRNLNCTAAALARAAGGAAAAEVARAAAAPE